MALVCLLSLSLFDCCPQVGYQYVALATPKQLIEISVANLLSPADWLFDDFEYGLESMRK